MQLTHMALVNGLAASRLFPTPWRAKVLNRQGMRIDRSVLIQPGFTITQRCPVTIGRNCIINMDVTVDGVGGLYMGERSGLAVGATILTGTHDIGGPGQRWGDLRSLPVRIGDGVWVGANATVLPGVTIGDGSIVAAGAVVTEDVAPNTVVAGVPARLVRKLD